MLLALSVMSPKTLGFLRSGDVVQTLANVRRSGESGLEIGKAELFLQAMSNGLPARRAEVSLLLAACLEVQGKERATALFARHWSARLPSAIELVIKSQIQQSLEELFTRPCGRI
jgi:hypothetical protein